MRSPITNISVTEVLRLSSFPKIENFLRYDEPIIDIRFNSFMPNDTLNYVNLSWENIKIVLEITKQGYLYNTSIINYKFQSFNSQINIGKKVKLNGVPRLAFQDIEVNELKYFALNGAYPTTLKYIDAIVINFYHNRLENYDWIMCERTYFGIEHGNFKSLIYYFNDNDKEIVACL